MKSYRNLFPFRIGTTSFILPVKEENLLSNAGFLRDIFDMVQLLFFGREYLGEILTPGIMKGLRNIREESGLSYTVHLPSDLELLDPSPGSLGASIDVIERVMEETEGMGITGYVLHVDRLHHGVPRVACDRETIELFHGTMDAIGERLGARAAGILIENTTYDLAGFASPVLEGPCGVCMDLGHLLLHGHDPGRFLDVFGSRVGEVHLHGVEGGRNHRALARLDQATEALIAGFLHGGEAPVILEVYNLVDLVKTAACLEAIMG